MSVLVLTAPFLAWLKEHGFEVPDSPPVAWGLVALYEHDRAAAVVKPEEHQ